MTNERAILELDTVESTMTEAATRYANGAIGMWSAVLAREQTAGRGRLSRGWSAPRDSAVLATFVCEVVLPPERLGLLAIAAGVAVSEVLEGYGVTVALKWPNDLYVADKKLGGILIQTRSGNPTVAFVGLGLNLTATPPGLEEQAVSLAESGAPNVSSRTIAAEMLDRLRSLCTLLDGGAFAQVRNAWMARALWIGQTVEVRNPDNLHGRMVGIDLDGRLLLDLEYETRALAVGDIERGPRPAGALYT